MATLKPLNNLHGHTSIIRSLAFSPDGKTVASGSDDGTVRFWNIETGRPAGVIRKTQIIETLAFSPDGQVLAAGDRTIRLWRAATKDEVEAAGEWWKD